MVAHLVDVADLDVGGDSLPTRARPVRQHQRSQPMLSVFMEVSSCRSLASVVVERRAASIDDDRLGIDERRLVGSEEQRRHGDLFRPANSLGRMEVLGPAPLGGGIGKRVPIGFGDRRLDVARRDRVHPDAARGIFDGERPRQPDQRMLGDRIGESNAG